MASPPWPPTRSTGTTSPVRTAVDASQIWTWRLSAQAGGARFQSLWGPSLGAGTANAIAESGTTVYVVGQTYTTVLEGWKQVVLAYIY